MYGYLRQALDSLSTAAVLASWEATGILRLVYNAVPARAINIDLVPKPAASIAVSDPACADCHEPDPSELCPVCQHTLCADCRANHEMQCNW